MIEALIAWYGLGLISTALMWRHHRKEGCRSTFLKTVLGWLIMPLGGVFAFVAWLDLQYGPFGPQ